MRTLRLFAAAIALSLVMSAAASAEESFLSKLNPFSSKPAKPTQSRTFGTQTNRKPQKSMLGKTVDSVTNTTRTAWKKTTTALNPMRLLPGSKPKPAKNKTSSSWSLFPRTEEEPQTMGKFLTQDRPN